MAGTDKVAITIVAQSTATVLSTDDTISLDMTAAILTGTVAQSFERGIIAHQLGQTVQIDVPSSVQTDAQTGIHPSTQSIAESAWSGHCQTRCALTFIENT